MGRVRGETGSHLGGLIGRLIVILNTASVLVKLASGASPLRVAGVHNAAATVSYSDTQTGSHISSLKQVEQQLAKLTLPPTESHPFLEPISSSQHEMSALAYLQRYGYMGASSSNSEANNLISEDSFSSAVKDFQKFAGISETGIVDEQTFHYMQLPRCGNSDRSKETDEASISWQRKASSLKRRRKRYALQGSKWRRQELTYRISQYPTRFTGKRHEVDAQIERAFGVWSQVAPINFVVKREGRVHIDIRFASGDHGDGDAFDGPGNTLAHAYFPQYGGDAHFDDQEYWTIDSYAGTNIFQVAAHELGHSLGLGHSNVREALMAPFYQKFKPNFKLHIDDVLAIQALYGDKPSTHPQSNFLANELPQHSNHPLHPDDSNHHHHHHHHHHDYHPNERPLQTTTLAPTSTSTTTSTTTTTTTTTAAPQTTSQPIALKPRRRIDAHKPFPPIYGGGGGNGREMNEDEMSAGRMPGKAGGLVPDLAPFNGNGLGPNGADTNQAGAHQPDLCTDPILDAITRTDDGNSYAFKGDFYWLLTSDGIAKGYPRRIALDWEGLPGSLDAALTWADGKTFFFKGNKYWRFRNKRREIGYPKLISAGFSGIPDDIDAAFVWGGNGRTYIFKGPNYWRFDSKAEPPVSAEYPRSIGIWNGLPADGLDAAFKWENNVTYFFKGSEYFRFNDKDFKVESRGRPPFPRPSADWWFGCTNSNLAAQRALPPVAPSGQPAADQHRRSRTNISSQYELELANAKRAYNSSSSSQDFQDWSFFVGLDEGKRIKGTHISDERPAGETIRTNFSTAESNFESRQGSRIDFLYPVKTVSSSAISFQHLLFHLNSLLALFAVSLSYLTLR